MRYATATLVACFSAAVGLASFEEAPVAQERGATKHRADPNRGRFVAIGGEFGEKRFVCASCHGFRGAANASGAFPRLAGQSGWYLYTSLRDFASGRRPSKVMGPVALELSDDEMMDVAAYYASIASAPATVDLRRNETLARRGREIAMNGLREQGVPACASCHGSASPLYPYLGGQYQPYLEHQLHLFKKRRRGGDPMNVMHEIAEKLGDRDIKAVATFFASQSPPMGGGESEEAAPTQKPEPIPMRTGAALDPHPGSGKVVVPNATTASPH